MNKKLMKKYAELAINIGVNVQKEQLLVITANVKDYEFVEMCVKEAYKKGASKVMIDWNDEYIAKLHYQYQSLETLKEVPQWAYDKRKYVQDKGCCYLHILSDTPGYFDDVDQEKIRESQLAAMQKMADLREYTMSNYGQWSIIALPTSNWAKKVFKGKTEDEALKLLSKSIFNSVHIKKDNDPIEEWHQHSSELKKRCELMNKYQFKSLHFTSELKTDLTVGLVENHIWEGGSSKTVKTKIEFHPNMPTEEIFTMPDRNNVNGLVYASKPLNYAGKVINDFWFEFKDGKVINYGAKKNKEALKTLFSTDEGASYLGEVALISYDSPISLMNVLFYETLFDENASCHLALGACYPENIKDGINMSREELMNHGGNYSMEHLDFMFGTKDLKVIGLTKDNKEVVIFDKGNFVI